MKLYWGAWKECFLKCANSLSEIRKMRLCVQEGDGGLQGAYFPSALFCIQRSKGSEPGSYPDSSESQAGLCILLFPPLLGWGGRGQGGGGLTRSSIRKSSQSTSVGGLESKTASIIQRWPSLSWKESWVLVSKREFAKLVCKNRNCRERPVNTLA